MSAGECASGVDANSTIRVRVLLFAYCREVCGIDETFVELKVGATTADAVQVVLGRFPGLGRILPSVVLTVNLNYIDAGSVISLKEGDEVALIPPISGG